MTLRAAALAVLVAAGTLASCARALPPAPTRAPSLTAAGALRAVLAADDARRYAFAGGATAGLRPSLSGRALAVAVEEASRLRRLGEREEEQVLRRTLVHWRQVAPGSGEAVLEVLSRQRLVAARGPGPPWSTVLAQWQAQLAWSGRRWTLADALELPPDQWWTPHSPAA